MAAPTVVSVSPAGSATGVSMQPAISITMSQAVNPATALITMTSGAGARVNIQITGAFLYYDSNAALGNPVTGSIPDHTFHSGAQEKFLLLPGTVYTVTISGVQNLAGEALASPYSWSFTTI